jgi:hypothetical protein
MAIHDLVDFAGEFAGQVFGMSDRAAQPAANRLRLSGMSKQGTARCAPAMTVLALLLAATIAGCQRTGPDGVTAGTVRGKLLRVGGPAPGAPFPLPGQVTATAPGGAPARTVTVGKNGRFAISNLPVGSYSLTGTSPLIDSGQATCRAGHTVHVRTAKVTRVDVICSIS